MAWYWFLRGRFSEAMRSRDAALALDGDVPTSARAKARCWRAGIILLTGQAASPAEHSDTALPPFDDIDDPVSRARAAWFLGFARSDFGDLSASQDLVNQALAASRARNDPWGVAAALGGGGKGILRNPVPATAQGDVDRVTAAARAALGDQVFTAEFERGKELGIATVESAGTSA